MPRERDPSIKSQSRDSAAARRKIPCLGLTVVAVSLILGAASRAADDPDKSSFFSFSGADPKRTSSLVGDQACVQCHAEKVRTFRQTAHARTSALASAESIHGRFGADANTLATVNPDLYFVMESVGKGFTQTAHMRTSGTQEMSRSEKIDIVVGSGRKGQTYLFWDGDQLFELPVSYWTGIDAWVNSPGYIDGTANFDRAIVPRCLECHASSFASRPPPENRYDIASLVLGVTCEKCHGPGSEHVARFRSASPPKAAAEYAIINPARLPRLRQLDTCALCHAGSGTPLAPALSFVPGDNLHDFVKFKALAPTAHADVHVSQVQLLERSRCFRSTSTLTCLTCHDVHAPQRDTAAFVARCLECHKVDNCPKFTSLGHAIDTRCIDCHMPLQETSKITSGVNGQSMRPRVRNHQIAIYPDVVLQ